MAKAPSLMTSVPPFEEVIGEIASLSDKAYSALRRAVESEDAFDASPRRCFDLAQAMETSSELAFLILKAVALIYDRVSDLSPDLPAKEVLANFVDEAQPDMRSEIKTVLVSRLAELSKVNPKAEIQRKHQRLKSGFLHTATKFESFVDLRPDFDEPRERVLGFLPLIQFRITTEDASSAEELVFQLDEKGLVDLKEAVELADKKLMALRGANAASAPIYFRKEDKA